MVSEILEEADRRLAEKVFELATQIDLQTQQIGHQGNFIGFLESQIVDYHKMMKEKNKDHSEAIRQWRDCLSKVTGEKDKLWNKIGLLQESLEDVEKQNKDNMSVMKQKILDLETKNEKSKTSRCISGIMSWCH